MAKNQPPPYLFENETPDYEMVVSCARLRPEAGIVLGSGLSSVADGLASTVSFPFESFVSLPKPGVKGHRGILTFGLLGETSVAVAVGRTHAYEGSSPRQITFLVRLLASLGATRLILTNAAGGLDPEMRVGDWMIADGILNFGQPQASSGWPPRGAGRRGDFVSEFKISMSEFNAAPGQALRRGSYAAVLGPNFETEAEIAALRALGASAVGMSALLEASAARRCGMRLSCFSCITNVAGADHGDPLTHDEVLAEAARAAPAMGDFIVWILESEREPTASSRS